MRTKHYFLGIIFLSATLFSYAEGDVKSDTMRLEEVLQAISEIEKSMAEMKVERDALTQKLQQNEKDIAAHKQDIDKIKQGISTEKTKLGELDEEKKS